MKAKVAGVLLLGLCLVCLSWGTTAPLAADVQVHTRGANENVFPPNKVIDVKITIDEADFQDMLDNPLQEEYKPADIEYNGTTIRNVGIRTKGNLTLRSVANTDSDRYSWKIQFDKYIDGQTLHGLTKINLNNNYADPTFMREYLTYELLEEMGVPTPGRSYVNVYVNGELRGFYLAVEQINEPYLTRHFGDAYGALYKPDGEGSDLVWKGDDISLYSGLNLKSETSNGDVILDMLDELNNGTDYEKVIDVDSFLRYLAVSTILVNMDSYQGNLKHNYYLYEQNGVFTMLPWDFNMSFAGLTMGGMGNTQQNAGVLIDEPTMGRVAERPMIAKLLQNETYKQTYRGYVKQIVDGYLSDSRFEARVQSLAELISPYVERDPSKFYTYEEYRSSLNQDVQNIPGLLSFTKARVANVLQQLAGTIPTSNNGEGSEGGMGGGRGNPNGQGGMGGGMPNGGGQLGNFGANPGANANGQGQQGQRGQGQQGQGQQGGPFGPGGGMGGPMGEGGQRPGGGAPGMPGTEGWMNGTDPAAAQKEAILAGSAVALLLLSALFIYFYRRKTW
ncbi:CotH kinase family protein [Paenibacillus oceani]|uniref:CotH kinase family protein n=1 Tax=Paenibacillus oceani TaxID=2772510 RepID=A0A927CHH9_9BACL|nr:CotH kinase family protein [Paenibacillus oceani]MBD2866707.1 CotH kinase family protein [Paenibacillus oceani]